MRYKTAVCGTTGARDVDCGFSLLPALDRETYRAHKCPALAYRATRFPRYSLACTLTIPALNALYPSHARCSTPQMASKLRVSTTGTEPFNIRGRVSSAVVAWNLCCGQFSLARPCPPPPNLPTFYRTCSWRWYCRLQGRGRRRYQLW